MPRGNALYYPGWIEFEFKYILNFSFVINPLYFPVVMKKVGCIVNSQTLNPSSYGKYVIHYGD